jgi:hypothetical protein
MQLTRNGFVVSRRSLEQYHDKTVVQLRTKSIKAAYMYARISCDVLNWIIVCLRPGTCCSLSSTYKQVSLPHRAQSGKLLTCINFWL